ncbi:MAG: hypothetical protein QME52_14205, partial [Bacteroidota bacterium]|nr:hypothetical protein [Bacteroidota bacterium]
RAIADLGYRGVDKIGETEVVTPKKRALTKYGKVKLRADHRRRSSIEAGLSHLKNGNRLGRNYYRHIAGDVTNVLLASAGYNFKRTMRKWKEMFKYFLSFLVFVLETLFVPQKYYPLPKMTF